MKKIYLFLPILATFLLSACSSDDNIFVENPDIPVDDPNWELTNRLYLTVADHNTASDLRLFYYNFMKVAAANAGGNDFCCSPLSAEMYLAALANGAEGETLSQILSALNSQDVESLNTLNEKLMHFMPNPGNGTCAKINTHFWVADRYSVNPDFRSKIQTVFNGDVESVDFSNSKTVPTINKWVSYKTNGLIESLLSGSWKNYVNLPMACANTIYLNGDWAEKFEPKDTKTEKFKTPNGERKVKMMNMVEYTGYYSNEKFQYVKKNLEGYEYYMELILPAEGVSINEAMELFTPEISMALQYSTTYRVTLGLPSFITRNSFDIADIMKKMGLDMASMNLSGIGIGTQPVGTGQETYLKVYEDGIEGAAVTGGWVSSGPSHNYREVEVKFNRPFIYIIRNSETGAALLAGAVVNP